MRFFFHVDFFFYYPNRQFSYLLLVAISLFIYKTRYKTDTYILFLVNKSEKAELTL